MCVRRILALLSANSRELMSFSLALYLFTCSKMISSTQLKHKTTGLFTYFKSCILIMHTHINTKWPSYAVVLLMSCTLCRGSMLSGHRRIQGANTIARALALIRFVSSCNEILKNINKFKEESFTALKVIEGQLPRLLLFPGFLRFRIMHDNLHNLCC